MSDTTGHCVFGNAASGMSSGCIIGDKLKFLNFCCDYGKPRGQAVSTWSHPKGHTWNEANDICDKMCTMKQFVRAKTYTGNTAYAWTDKECKLAEECIEELDEADHNAMQDLMYPNNTIDVTGNDMLITFLFAALILLCVANLFVFIRRKLRRRPRYAALDKVANSDTDTEAVLINN